MEINAGVRIQQGSGEERRGVKRAHEVEIVEEIKVNELVENIVKEIGEMEDEKSSEVDKKV